MVDGGGCFTRDFFECNINAPEDWLPPARQFIKQGLPMVIRLQFLMVFSALLTGSLEARDTPNGLLAEWTFDEGQGDLAADSSGHGLNATIYGATWIKQGNGYALTFDGLDDYVACTAEKPLAVEGPITIESWIKPMAKSQGLASLFGESLSSYLVGYYAHAEFVYLFIGGGGNKVYHKINFKQWNHIAATFDGKQLQLWINGRSAATNPTQFPAYKTSGGFTIGTKGRPDLPKYKGMIDHVRVYNRALTEEEVVTHFRAEAPHYGFDPSLFRRVQVKPYYYFDHNKIILEVDWTFLQPLQDQGKLHVSLTPQQPGSRLVQDEVIMPTPPSGNIDITLSTTSLPPGNYVARVEFTDGDHLYPVELVPFTYPQPTAPLPPPSKTTVSSLPDSKPTSFSVKVHQAGGFSVGLDDSVYQFTSRISWPHGEFNYLGKNVQGEPKWQPKVEQLDANTYRVHGHGDYYEVKRTLQIFSTHIAIADTFSNHTDDDLGLLVYNELNFATDSVASSRIGGFQRGGRLHDVFSPSIFVDDGQAGIGMLPLDDVFVIQSVLYNEFPVMGMGTEKLALAPGGSYTLQWAVYPTGSRDYYDFINTFRTVENRIGTIDGGLGFFTAGPKNRDQIPAREFLQQRGIQYGLMHNLAGIVDDPQLSIQGIEFIDFPKERARLQTQATAIHADHPDLKIAVHLAHSLYCTNDTDRYADSKVILKNGKQATWGVPHAYISKERQDAGWKFWVFYPTPGNLFHKAMLNSVDVLLDEIGMDGAFMDGFFAGYGSRWTYDGRWDGFSAEIDLKTKTIQRKIGSVLLLSQPSMIEFCRKIHDKGGVVVANNTVVTRSIANEQYILHDSESGAGPQLHLAPTLTALASPTTLTPRDVYQNTLENLRWGELFMYYRGNFEAPYRSLASRQFPMTFEEVRAGMVRGPERIVTMNSGIYSWPGKRQLHQVYKFDARGAPTTHDFLTTVDQAGVRTLAEFRKDESAVIVPVPITLESTTPVNVRLLRYDDGPLTMLLNGRGPAKLEIHQPGIADTSYRATVNGQPTPVTSNEERLSVSLPLTGPVELVLDPR